MTTFDQSLDRLVMGRMFNERVLGLGADFIEVVGKMSALKARIESSSKLRKVTLAPENDPPEDWDDMEEMAMEAENVLSNASIYIYCEENPPAEGECVAMHMGTGSVDCEALETFMDLMVVCVAFCEIWATFYPPAAVLLVFFLAWLAAAALLHALSC